MGLQLDTNVAGDCIVAYVVPDFAAERSGLFGVDDLILSINGNDLSGVSFTPSACTARARSCGRL